MENQEPKFELSESDFLTLLVKHEPAFRGYARSFVPDWDLVDEALQETSVTMWQKRDQLQNVDGFAPWGESDSSIQVLASAGKASIASTTIE